MLHRFVLLAVASFFCLASASSTPAQQPQQQAYYGQQQQQPYNGGYQQQPPQGQPVGYNNNQGSSDSESSLVLTETMLDSDMDAIGVFELAARNKGCQQERADEPTYKLLIVNCNDGAVVVAQAGRKLVIGCKKDRFTQEQCSSYAVNLLEYAKAGGGQQNSNPGFGGGGGGAGFGN